MAAEKTEDPVAGLTNFLEGEYMELKQSLRAHIKDNPLFRLRFDLPLDEARKITFERAKYLWKTPPIQNQFSDQISDQRSFILKNLALGEVVSTTDLSVGVKMGVMGWLFGGAVTNLGSEEHIEKWFKPLKDLEFTGMFCMSERGHGSNVRGIQTEAHYDPSTEEFVINTPTPDAQKIYIGNALQGNYGAVFAQLYVGGKCRGPHCFIVPIRDTSGLFTGVSVQDQGMKEGLNGVDNGLLSFSEVRIPRSHLLNRYADVTPGGEYVTTVTTDGARFNTVLGALLGTRIALCLQSLACTKMGLEIAIKYGLRRRQFGPTGEPEHLLMDYQTHQVRLMPRLATALALTFAVRSAGRVLAEDVHNDVNIVDDRPLQALAAGLKAYSTWETVATLQECRECTGGMGYMEENRISSLKRDADVFVTFEGDNVVMMQQVTKELLVQYGKKFEGSKVKAIVCNLKDKLVESFKTSFLAVTTDPVWSETFVVKALRFKEGMLLRHLAARLLSKVSSENEQPFLAWNDCLDHVLTLAWAHVQRVTLEQFALAVSQCPDAGTRAVLQKFCHLHAVHLLHTDKAWYLEQGYITPNLSKEIRDKYLELCSETREHALELVTAFCHPEVCLHAPIAGIPSEMAPWAYHPNSDMGAVTKSKL